MGEVHVPQNCSGAATEDGVVVSFAGRDKTSSSELGVVNTTPPDTEIHEQMTMTNGYVKVCTMKSTPSITVRPLWTTT